MQPSAAQPPLSSSEQRLLLDAIRREVSPDIRNKLEAWQGTVVEVGTAANAGKVRLARADEPTTAGELLRNFYPVIGEEPIVGAAVWALSWYGGGIVITSGSNVAATIEGVSNAGGNIDLVGSGGITVTGDDSANTITVGRAQRGAFFAYRSGSDQSGILATGTQVQFNSEEFDVDGWYSTSTFRYTPQLAGYYTLGAATRYTQATVDSPDSMELVLRKNGTGYRALALPHSSFDETIKMSGSAIVVANGTTDYFDILISHSFAANATLLQGSTQTFFWGHFV